MKLSTGRQAVYASGLLGIVGLVIGAAGLGTYDPVTGMVDLAPFNAHALIAAIPAVIAPAVAWLALALDWRK